MATWLSSMRRQPVARTARRLKRTRAAGPFLVARRRPYGRRLTRAIAVIVLVAFILPAVVPSRAEARQLILPTPPNLLNEYLLAKTTDSYPLPGTTGLFYPTPAQYAALLRLQQQAIAKTMTDHLLGGADAAAAQSWGRDEAIIELWSSFKEAAFAVNRGVATSDQRLVNAWLQTVLLRQNVRKAVAAGLEYVKYAGLDHARYQQIVAGLLQNEANGGASEDYCNPSDHGTLTCADFKALYDFMQTGFTSPKNYWAWTDGTSNATKMATATEGYCAYRSPSAPAGVDDDLPVYPDPDVDNSSLCLSPAPTIGCLIDCNPTPPSYDAFKTWGAILASQNLMSGAAGSTTTQDYTDVWNRIAIAAALGGVSIFAIGGITAGLLGGLAGYMAANTAIFTWVITEGVATWEFTAPMFAQARS